MRKHSFKAREAMRQAKLGRYNGEGNPMFGRIQTDATRALQSADAASRVWMYHPFDGCKRIKKEELKQYLADGWVQGRTFKALSQSHQDPDPHKTP